MRHARFPALSGGKARSRSFDSAQGRLSTPLRSAQGDITMEGTKGSKKLRKGRPQRRTPLFCGSNSLQEALVFLVCTMTSLVFPSFSDRLDETVTITDSLSPMGSVRIAPSAVSNVEAPLPNLFL